MWRPFRCRCHFERIPNGANKDADGVCDKQDLATEELSERQALSWIFSASDVLRVVAKFYATVGSVRRLTCAMIARAAPILIVLRVQVRLNPTTRLEVDDDIGIDGARAAAAGDWCRCSQSARLPQAASEPKVQP